MITVSNADAALKDYYLDVIKTQLNANVSPFYNAIEKTSDNIFGKSIKTCVIKGGMCGVRACNETDDLPNPRENRYLYVSQSLKNIYGTIQISDKVIRASADSSGALVNLLNTEMEGLINDAKSHFARMLYGDGNGTLAYIKSKVSTYVLEVDIVKNFYAGMSIELYTSSGTISTTISKVNREDSTITVAKDLDSFTIKSGDRVALSSSNTREITGLAAIFDNEWLYGYKKESEPYFKPVIISLERSALSTDDLIKMVDEIEEDSGHKVNMILCSYKTRRLIASLFEASRHIVNSTDIEAGCSSLYINEVPVYADKFCPDNRIYILNTNDFVLNQLCDWSWIEDESGRVLKQIPNKPVYTATIVKYAELFCKCPNAQGLIKLTD
ncbi:MAG: phage major capsid protein [Candidatus Coproplasma sp.]